MKLLQRILEILYPPKCVLCRDLLSKEETDLCHSCRKNAPCFEGHRRDLHFVQDYTAVWFYENDARGSILRYKFSNARSYAAAYSRMIAMRVSQDLPEKIDLVTWVPLGPKGLAKRGYDQVELLAGPAARELELPIRRLLKKIREDKVQSSLETPEERRANVLGAYALLDRDWVEGRNILLLDDVITTGATLSECARLLREAGAKNVYCAAVAAVRNPKQ